MPLLFGWAAKLVGARFAKAFTYGVLILIAIGFLWWALDSFAERRADARETEVRAEYKAASDRLKAEAARSATRADDAAVARLEQHQAQVQEEQERIDEAVRNGSSPFDVLFGG